MSDIADAIFAASVIPRRSVERVRRAIAEGRDPSEHLAAIEDGMEQIAALDAERYTDCPRCDGRGVIARETVAFPDIDQAREGGTDG